MHGICYLCGLTGEIAELPSGSHACLMCIYLYLSESNEEPAEVFKRCIKPTEPIGKCQEVCVECTKQECPKPTEEKAEDTEEEFEFNWLPPA